MKTYDFILSLDPSGSFKEGKGCTGWSVMDVKANHISLVGNIFAKDYPCMEGYWNAHLKIIDEFNKRYKGRLCIVMEDYLLYSHRAESQINSRMETPKVIGVIQHHCFTNKIPYYMQMASSVKNRWNNEILHYKGYIATKSRRYVLPHNNKLINKHVLDSIRHAVHFHTFKNKEE